MSQRAEKLCCTCKTRKPKSAFNKSRDRWDGLQPKCRQCTKNYYAENREKIGAQQRGYRERNHESVLAGQRKYRELNRKALAAKQRDYAKRNPEVVLALRRAWYERNRDSILVYHRRYREEHREKIAMQARRYREANPEKRAANARRYRKKNREKLIENRRRDYMDLVRPENILARLEKSERLMEEGRWLEAIRRLGPAILGLTRRRETVAAVRELRA